MLTQIKKTKLLLVGEARGQQEDIYNHGFVGASGRELASLLAQANIAPFPLTKCSHCRVLVTSEHSHCRNCKSRLFLSELEMIAHWQYLQTLGIEIANVFELHPENNNLETLFSPQGNKQLPAIKPNQYVLPQYTPHLIKLWEKIQALSPNLIVALGNGASWGLIGRGTGIRNFRGTLHTGFYEGLKTFKILPTFHPAYILRGQEEERVVVLADLSKAKREMESAEIHRKERWVTIATSLDEISAWLNKPAALYANDIESGYALFSRAEINKMTPHMRLLLSSQISIVSFARSDHDALVINLMTRDQPNLSYWDKEDEIKVWKLIIQGLQRPIPKIFQNGLYDITRYLERGIVPTMCYEDTMIRHHALYPELRKSLSFLASIYIDEIAWKQAYANREQLKRDE